MINLLRTLNYLRLNRFKCTNQFQPGRRSRTFGWRASHPKYSACSGPGEGSVSPIVRALKIHMKREKRRAALTFFFVKPSTHQDTFNPTKLDSSTFGLLCSQGCCFLSGWRLLSVSQTVLKWLLTTNRSQGEEGWKSVHRWAMERTVQSWVEKLINLTYSDRKSINQLVSASISENTNIVFSLHIISDNVKWEELMFWIFIVYNVFLFFLYLF